ncbi:hypothetical protein FG386_001712 [Cryptosporidium ryanae]|uniref:uncharacterized protein n=1 Tax=Cryptosporidium ryanae TaxID=515981 RepID=UPI00351A782E|nr:hypothetical protein FG386_001712 [Cryptosporidium ryanae]
MGEYNVTFEINDDINNRIVTLFYFEKKILEFINKKVGKGSLNERIITSLLVKNGNQYWIELRNSHSGDDKLFHEDSNLIFTFYINVPKSIELIDIFKVNYYSENEHSENELRHEIEDKILLIRILFNVKKKYSLKTNLVLDGILNDLNEYTYSSRIQIDCNETVSVDTENIILCKYIDKYNSRMLDEAQFNIRCKKCTNLISKYTDTCVVAPLPSEMLVHGSEVLACDNCHPLLNKNSSTNNYSFSARCNWICLGQYHISLNPKNVFGVEKNPHKVYDDNINHFFIKDINDVYYNGDRDYSLFNCSDCKSTLGWVNSTDGTYNILKSGILFLILNNTLLNSDISLFNNYSSISLFVYYIERYVRQGSSITVFNMDNKNQAINLYIVRKSCFRLKFSGTIDEYREHLDSGLNRDVLNGDIQYLTSNTSKSRLVLYNRILFTYKPSERCNPICSRNTHDKDCFDAVVECKGEISKCTCEPEARNSPSQVQGTSLNAHKVYIGGAEYEYLKHLILRNSLFRNHSSLNVPILCDDLVF